MEYAENCQKGESLMTGIKDIAKAAGVSAATVSNVLNGRKNVGEETRRNILRICEELSYVPNAAGKSLKSTETNTILFNFSDFDRNFYLDTINGISDYVNANDFDLMICTKKSCEKFMRSGFTSGCIILDMGVKSRVISEVASEHYPIVLLDRELESPYIKSVLIDNDTAMQELVQGLVDMGYRRFSFIGGPEKTADNSERYGAFLKVLERYGLPFSRKYYYSGDYRQKSGYSAARIMILSDTLPDCIVCANDNMAIGAIKALRENGIRVPEDVAVTGFDNSTLAEPMGLTTVDIPDYERGYLAAQNLIQNIRGDQDSETLRLGAVVKWRKTTVSRKSSSLHTLLSS